MFQILKPKLETNNMMIPNHTKFIHTMVMWPKHILAKENKATYMNGKMGSNAPNQLRNRKHGFTS